MFITDLPDSARAQANQADARIKQGTKYWVALNPEKD